MLLKIGSKGDDVKKLQSYLGLVADGVFGSKTEAAVKTYQKDHGLVVDGIVGDKTWDNIFSIDKPNIIYKPIDVHMYKYTKDRKIKYLVIHYTAGISSIKGSAEKNRNVFLTAKTSADFCVDNETIIQVNPNPLKYACWAVGDGNGKHKIYNKDCINIEMCSTLKKGNPAFPNHEGWEISDSVISNTIKLSKYLMNKYNIPIENVIRHYDATDKCCPGVIGWNDGPLYDISGKITKTRNNSLKWKDFKTKLI